MTEAAQFALITGGMLLANRIWSTIESRTLRNQVNLIEKNTNSLVSKLVTAEKIVSHAEGVAQEKQAEDHRQSVPAHVPAQNEAQTKAPPQG